MPSSTPGLPSGYPRKSGEGEPQQGLVGAISGSGAGAGHRDQLELGREFYLNSSDRDRRAIAPNAAWYCWHARRSKRCSKRLERGRGLRPSTDHLVEESASADLFCLYVGTRALPFRLDERPETRGRTKTGGRLSIAPSREIPSAESKQTNIRPRSRIGCLRSRWNCIRILRPLLRAVQRQWFTLIAAEHSGAAAMRSS